MNGGYAPVNGGYAPVNVNPPNREGKGDLAGGAISFDCKCVPDSTRLGEHFLFRLAIAGTKAQDWRNTYLIEFQKFGFLNVSTHEPVVVSSMVIESSLVGYFRN